MNKEQQEAYDKAQIMLAYARGEKIEFRETMDKFHSWSTAGSPSWNWADKSYRIAPKLIEVWLWRFNDGRFSAVTYGSAAETTKHYSPLSGNPILMREVIE